MKRLLKHEFFKVLNSLTIKVLLFVVAGLALLNSLSIVLLRNYLTGMLDDGNGIINGAFQGSQGMAAAFSDINNLATIMAIAIVVLTTHEYNTGSIKNTLLSDQARITIYIAKYIVTITVVTVFAIVNAIFYCSVNLIAFGWGGAFSFQSLWSNYILIMLLGLLLCYSLAAMVSFVAYSTKNTVLTIVTVFGVGVILTIFSIFESVGMGFFSWINQFSYTTVLMTYYLSKSSTDLLYYFVTVAMLFIPFFIGGLLVFKKQEIK